MHFTNPKPTFTGLQLLWLLLNSRFVKDQDIVQNAIYSSLTPLITKDQQVVTGKCTLRHIDVMRIGHLSRNMAAYFKTLYLALTSTYL